MPCFSPLQAWKTCGGEILFADRGDCRPLELPCGQCVGCRLERSRQWAMRCMHEAQLHEMNSFVTLTYNDENVSTSLDYRDFQLFMKRLRKMFGPTRFYMCGEYGETTFRPHFHALLFGLDFGDKTSWRKSSGGFQLYRSATLERLWPYGNSEIGGVSFESAAYVARYCMKKVTGPAAVEHYKRVDIRTGEIISVQPEFTRMSLKPGIGFNWIRLYRTDVYRGDGEPYVVVNGMKSKPPRYYDQYVSDLDEYQEVQHRRYKRALLNRDECTDERLQVRERVARSRLHFKQRSLE